MRERGLLPLEEAVHLLTGAPAALYGLHERGRVAAGWCADLQVFDPATMGPGPVAMRFDLPGGAGRVYGEAVGVHHVVVNGVPCVEHGELLPARPGTLLRSGIGHAARCPCTTPESSGHGQGITNAFASTTSPYSVRVMSTSPSSTLATRPLSSAQ